MKYRSLALQWVQDIIKLVVGPIFLDYWSN